MSASALSLLEAVCRQLDEFALLCDQALLAIDHGDDRIVRELIHRSRRMRSGLARAEDEIKLVTLDPTPEALDLLTRLTELTDRVRAGDDAMRTWMDRARPSDEELLRSPEGTAELIDASLPLAWDETIDLAILVGEGALAAARDLAGRGQRRILVFLPGGSGAPASTTDYPPETLIVHSVSELRAALQTLPSPRPSRAFVKRLPDPQVTDEIDRQVHAAMHSLLEEMQVRSQGAEAFGELLVRNGIANLPEVASRPSIRQLCAAFAGKPIAIVGNGPSLVKSAAQLRELHGKAIVLSFASALPTLRAAGVAPDLILIGEPDAPGLADLPVDEVGALLLSVIALPALFGASPRVVTFAAHPQLDRWLHEALGEDLSIPAGGSLGCLAFSLAHIWRSSPVVLVGLDLALADGEGTRAGERTVQLRGYHGGEVTATFLEGLLHRWYEVTARDLTAAGATLLNATEGGSYIDGMEHVPLAEAIRRVEGSSVDVRAAVEAAQAGLDLPLRRERMLGHVREMLAALDHCVEVAERCAQLAEVALISDERLDELAELDRELVEALHPVLFVSLLRQRAMREATDRARKTETINENLQAEKELYSIIIDAEQVLRPELERAEAALQQLLNPS